MSAKKCIYKAGGKDEEDLENITSPCFQISPEVKLKDIPTTGEEYLLNVMNERRKYPTVTICTKDFSKYAKNQSCFVEELQISSAPHKLKPTIEWQNIQVADFSDIRRYIQRVLRNRTIWPGELKKVDIEQNTIQGWKWFFDQNEPTLKCVLGLKSGLLDRGLEMLTQILDDVSPGSSIDHKTGQWIYSFLACTPEPLVADTHSILRYLARKCADIRSQINVDDDNVIELVAPLNLFICLVSRYFRQYDLAD